MSIDLHTLAGAYALHALSPEEAEEFDKHLAECPACRDEVREFREAAASMGEIEATPPPPDLKTRVMEHIDRTPQLPPRSRSNVTRMPVRRTAPRLLAAAAVIAVVAAGAIGISQINDEPTPGSTLASGVTRVFSADDAITQRVNTPEGTVIVAASPELNEMAIDTDELHTLDASRDYQLWAIHDDEISSVGIISPEKGASMEMPAPGTQVAITVEPAGGSQQPTTKPLFQVNPAKA